MVKKHYEQLFSGNRLRFKDYKPVKNITGLFRH